MGLFKKNKRGHNLRDEETRALAYEQRRINKELSNARQEIELAKLQQKAEIENLKLERERLRLEQELEDLRGDGEEMDAPTSEQEMQNMLLMQLAGNFLKPQQNSFSGYNAPAAVTPEYQGVDLSDDTIDQLINSIPKKYAKIAIKMSDHQLSEIIKTRAGPYATEASISRIIKRFREKFK